MTASRSYKLVVVPADYVMDAASAKAIRDYVSAGGTVLMTAYSAKVDEHGLWFDTPLPGRLNDVFGLRTAQFYEPDVLPEFRLDGKTAKASIRYYEVLEPRTADYARELFEYRGQSAGHYREQVWQGTGNLSGGACATVTNRPGRSLALWLIGNSTWAKDS